MALREWEKLTIGYTLAVPVIFVRIVWQGWCASLLWQWYVVPVFALPPLDTWQATGLIFAILGFKPTNIPKPDRPDDPKRTLRHHAMWLAGPAVLLAFGFALKVVQ